MNKLALLTVLAMGLAFTGAQANTGTTKTDANSAAVPTDSTAANKRDASNNTLTPMDQSKGSNADVEITRKIREEIVKNDSISTYAQNIKIITLNGKVTLRGPVKTQSEITYIRDVAERIAGKTMVVNQLELAAKSTY